MLMFCYKIWNTTLCKTWSKPKRNFFFFPLLLRKGLKATFTNSTARRISKHCLILYFCYSFIRALFFPHLEESILAQSINYGVKMGWSTALSSCAAKSPPEPGLEGGLRKWHLGQGRKRKILVPSVSELSLLSADLLGGSGVFVTSSPSLFKFPKPRGESSLAVRLARC